MKARLIAAFAAVSSLLNGASPVQKLITPGSPGDFGSSTAATRTHIAIGSPSENGNKGAVYLYSPATGGLLRTKRPPLAPLATHGPSARFILFSTEHIEILL